MFYNVSMYFVYLIHSSLYFLSQEPCFVLLPFLFLLISTNLFSISVSLFQFSYIYFLSFFHILHVSDSIQYMSFSVWFISLSIVPYKPIHVVANGRSSFFFYDIVKTSLRTKLVEVMEFQLSYFKFWKIMLWKCCTQ